MHCPYHQQGSNTPAAAEPKAGPPITLEGLHQAFSIPREPICSGQSDKAINVREFAHYMRHLPLRFTEMADSIPTAQLDTIAGVIANATSHREMILVLRRECAKFLYPTCYKYLRELENPKSLQIEDRAAYEKFKATFGERTRRLRVRGEETRPDVTPENRDLVEIMDILLGGVSNALHVSWSLMDVVPEVFFDATGKVPTTQEYAQVAESLQPILMSLILSHDDVFNSVNLFLRGATGGPTFEWPAFRGECFRLNGLKLELVPELFEAALPEVQAKRDAAGPLSVEPRVGCAGFAIVPAVHGWCLAAAKTTLFHQAPHLRTLAP